MIARMSMAATLAFLLVQIKLFRRVSYHYASAADKIKLAVIFGLIGIGGTYVGIPVDDALANSRVVGVMAAGLVGGPLVGIGAGLVAGGHRFSWRLYFLLLCPVKRSRRAFGRMGKNALSGADDSLAGGAFDRGCR